MLEDQTIDFDFQVIPIAISSETTSHDLHHKFLTLGYHLWPYGKAVPIFSK